MDVLSGRLLLTPTDPDRSHRFYSEVLELAVAREFGPPEHRGVVYFMGSGFLEVSGQSDTPPGPGVRLWLQVRDVYAEQRRLEAAGVAIVRAAKQEFWGLVELWIEDPDGVPIVLVEVPSDHPLRRDVRS